MSKRETKHTPGPWYAQDRVERYVVLAEGYDYEIASVDGPTSGRADEEANDNTAADAALVAAAPTMLAALQQARQLIEEALPKFNWAASALDANAIRLLNETPAVIRRAILDATGDEP